MRAAIVDVETTTIDKGHPFDPRNKLCVVGIRDAQTSESWIYKIEYDSEPYGEALDEIRVRLGGYDLLVGFNIKFDLHWLTRYGISIRKFYLWDCQVVEFILGNQTNPYPSLDETAAKYQLGEKLKTVEEYWNAGIDTPDIPLPILVEYLGQDLALTQRLYEAQKQILATTAISKRTLCKIACYDTKVLQEIEYNGMLCDLQKLKQMEEELSSDLARLDRELRGMFPSIPINFNSVDHLSACLYGGVIRESIRVENGVYKTGAKAGEVRYRIEEKIHELPRLVEPDPKSKLKKDNLYSTDETFLRKVYKRGNSRVKRFIDLLLEHADVEKRLSTYIVGFQKLAGSHHWFQDEKILKIHGQLNQCVARTGRLSSSEPNLQNIDGSIKDIFITRYG